MEWPCQPSLNGPPKPTSCQVKNNHSRVHLPRHITEEFDCPGAFVRPVGHIEARALECAVVVDPLPGSGRGWDELADTDSSHLNTSASILHLKQLHEGVSLQVQVRGLCFHNCGMWVLQPA